MPHYRILSKLGEGGMGTVYRATDTKLNRDVAVKLLPESLAGDADRMSRFRRAYEAQGDTFHPGRSRRWSETPIQLTGIFPPLDLAPDGKRFVVFPAPQSTSPPGSNAHVTFLIHFFDELNRRIPPK